MAISTEEFIKQIDGMTVLDLNNLVKALESHYGVSAAAAAAGCRRRAADLPKRRLRSRNRPNSPWS